VPVRRDSILSRNSAHPLYHSRPHPVRLGLPDLRERRVPVAAMVPVQEAGSYGGGPMSVYIIEVDLTEEEIMEELDSKLKRNGRWNE
jgi:hypothetical protein